MTHWVVIGHGGLVEKRRKEKQRSDLDKTFLADEDESSRT